jgi:hypothetical protein
MDEYTMIRSLIRVSEHLSRNYTAADALADIKARLKELWPRLAELTAISVEHPNETPAQQEARVRELHSVTAEVNALQIEQGSLRRLLQLKASATRHKKLGGHNVSEVSKQVEKLRTAANPAAVTEQH